jgi:hypothetical protein
MQNAAFFCHVQSVPGAVFAGGSETSVQELQTMVMRLLSQIDGDWNGGDTSGARRPASEEAGKEVVRRISRQVGLTLRRWRLGEDSEKPGLVCSGPGIDDRSGRCCGGHQGRGRLGLLVVVCR